MSHRAGRRHRWRGSRLLFAAWMALAAGSGCTDRLPGFGSRPGVDTGPDQPTVVFVSSGTVESLPAEEAAAWAWLQEQQTFASRHVQLIDLPRAPLPRNAVLWWHYAQEEGLPSAAVRPETLEAIRRHLSSGGRLLLTLLAAPYAVPLGFETAPPDTVHLTLPAYPRVGLSGGLQSRLGHPVLARFWGGVFTSTPSVDRRYPEALYTADRWPAQGQVWAVHKSEIGVDPATKIGVEYAARPDQRVGTVLTLGAHCHFSDAGNRNAGNLHELVAGALGYLADQPPLRPPGLESESSTAAPGSQDPGTVPGARAAGQPPGGDADLAAPAATPLVLDGTRRFWTPGSAGAGPSRAPVSSGAGAAPADALTVINLVEGTRSGTRIVSYPTSDSPFTLASPLALVSGSQLGRINEVWAHPLRIVRNLRFGVVRTDRGITWLDEGGGERTFTARPEGDELYFTDGDIEATLHLAVDRRHGAMVALLAIRSPSSVDVVTTWEIDHAASWLPGDALLGPLQLGWDAGAHAAVWSDAGQSFSAMAGFGIEPSVRILGFSPESDLVEDGLRVAEVPDVAEVYGTPGVAIQVRVEPDRPALVPFIVVGGMRPPTAIRDAFVELVADPGRPWVDGATYFRDFLDARTLQLLTPDEEIDRSFQWAKLGIEALRVTAPGFGTGIFSGYSTRTSREVWLAPQNVYGGGEALWAAMAAGAYGDEEFAADILRFLARYQGSDGRVPSAVSPSWDLHYDRLETTPLFVIALERHLSTWGDWQLLQQLWPAALAALDWGSGADADGDNLIEAFSEADRWHASGEVETTIHLAALWGAALDAGSRMAGWIGDDQRASQLGDQAEAVRQTLNAQFWDPVGRHFQFAKRRDGTFVGTRTILPAIPMIFGMLDSGNAIPALDTFGSAELSTDWGVAFASQQETTPDAPGETAAGAPDADTGDPPAVVRGLVSPLFTGWAALAEYANHRGEAGYSHLVSNLRLLGSANPGYAPEALSRERYVPVGDLAHSAAGHALTVLPVVHGLLGIRPDAMAGTLEVIPDLPVGWEHVTVDALWIGDNEYRLRISRSDDGTEFIIDRIGGNDPVNFRLGARVPLDVPVVLNPDLRGAQIVEPQTKRREGDNEVLVVVVRQTESQSIVSFGHEPFPRVIPEPLRPAEGDPSTGLRIVRSTYLGGTLRLQLEGLPGRSYALRLATPWPIGQVTGVPDASVSNHDDGSATIETVIPGSGNTYRRVELEVSFVR